MKLKLFIGFLSLFTIGMLILLLSLFLDLSRLMKLEDVTAVGTMAIHTAITVCIIKILLVIFIVFAVSLLGYHIIDEYRQANKIKARAKARTKEVFEAAINNLKGDLKSKPLTPKESISADDVLNFDKNVVPVSEYDIAAYANKKPIKKVDETTQAYADRYNQWVSSLPKEIRGQVVTECLKRDLKRNEENEINQEHKV